MSQRTAQGDEDGYHGSRRGACHAFYAAEDAFFFKHLKGANVGNAFDTAAFEDEVLEVVLVVGRKVNVLSYDFDGFDFSVHDMLVLIVSVKLNYSIIQLVPSLPSFKVM